MSSLRPFNSDTPKHSFSLFCHSQPDSEQLDIQVLLLRRWPRLLPHRPPTVDVTASSPDPAALSRLGLRLSHESLLVVVVSPDFSVSFAVSLRPPAALPSESLHWHTTDRLRVKLQTSESLSATPCPSRSGGPAVALPRLGLCHES